MSRAKKTKGAWAALVAGMTLAAAAGLVSTGCSIRTQAPIKEIAYDFSDRDFYDRAYASSPKYAELEPVYVAQEPLRQRGSLESLADEQPAALLSTAALPGIALGPNAVADEAPAAAEGAGVVDGAAEQPKAAALARALVRHKAK